MPVLSVTKNYSDGSTLTQSHLDTAFTSVETFLNTTKIDSANLQSGAVTTATLAASAVDSTKLAASAVTTTALADANVTLAKLASDATVFLNPTGVMLPYAGVAAPSGYLMCDGSAVSRTTYAALFAVLSTTWGAGDASTTFNVPDLRCRGLIGAGAGSGLTVRTLASTGGEETHVLSTAEMPAHTHDVAAAAEATAGTATPYRGTGNSGLTFTTNSTGGGGAHNNMQPWVAANFIIKT